MELVGIAFTVLASLATGVLSFRVPALWLRLVAVVGVAYLSSRALPFFVGLGSDDQRSSWAPLLSNSAFGVGAVLGAVYACISHLLVKLGARARERNAARH